MATLNKDEFEDGAARFGGSVKEEIGQTTNGETLAREGGTDQFKGNIQENFGTLKHKLSDASEDADNFRRTRRSSRIF